MKLKRFNTGENSSSTQFSCADGALKEVKNLFFQQQLIEENILIELYSPNSVNETILDQTRLNIDHVFSKRQISKKCLLGRYKFVDSFNYQNDYSAETILQVKNEQRRLGLDFKGFYILTAKGRFSKERKKEPLLFLGIGNNTFYLLNAAFQLKEDKKAASTTSNKFAHWIKNETFLKTFFK